MEFRLTYSGNDLKAASASDTRAKEKQRLRLHFHDQLKRLWETHPLLQAYANKGHGQAIAYPPDYPPLGMNLQAYAKERSPIVLEFPGHREPEIFTPAALARQFQGYVPLIMKQFGMLCELDILFLRPEPPGGVIKMEQWGGDIDNRLKTLLDGLRAPARGELIPSVSDEPAPDPLYVLLEDDSLISAIKLSADRLLNSSSGSSSRASVVITVTTKVLNPFLLPYGIQP